MKATQFQSFQRRLKYESSPSQSGTIRSVSESASIVTQVGPTGPAGNDGNDGKDGKDGKDAVTNILIQEQQKEMENLKNEINQSILNLSKKIDTSLKGDIGPRGPQGEKGDIAIKNGIVFKKINEQHCVSNNCDDDKIVINGWSSSSFNNSCFSTDTINILILKKGKYFVTANIDVSNLLINGVTFEIYDNKNNDSTTTSKCRIPGPILVGYNSGYIHGIIDVESSTSFKIISKDTFGKLTILKSCQLTILEL